MTNHTRRLLIILSEMAKEPRMVLGACILFALATAPSYFDVKLPPIIGLFVYLAIIFALIVWVLCGFERFNAFRTSGRARHPMTLLIVALISAAIAFVAGPIIWLCLTHGQAAPPAVTSTPLAQPRKQPSDSPALTIRTSLSPADDSGVKEVKTVYRSEPTPEHIVKTVAAAPPMARESVFEQFIGAPVSWDGRLRDIQNYEGITTIFMNYGLEKTSLLPKMVLFDIDPSKHSYLLQMPEGSPIHVDGVIEKIGPVREVYLSDAHVRALE